MHALLVKHMHSSIVSLEQATHTSHGGQGYPSGFVPIERRQDQAAGLQSFSKLRFERDWQKMIEAVAGHTGDEEGRY